MNGWGTAIEIERRNRIMVSLWAFAYEIMSHSLISDAIYDQISRSICPFIRTGNDVMDEFFLKEFDPSTGLWIHHHPEIKGIRRLYERLNRTP